MTDILHRPALAALLDEATTHQRWRSRNAMASECGFSPSTLSLALSGQRPLPDHALESLIDCTGWPREAVMVPAVARRGDLETARLLLEVKRLREQVLRGTDDIAEAIRERGD